MAEVYSGHALQHTWASWQQNTAATHTHNVQASVTVGLYYVALKFNRR